MKYHPAGLFGLSSELRRPLYPMHVNILVSEMRRSRPRARRDEEE